MAAVPSFRLAFARSKLAGRGALSICVRPLTMHVTPTDRRSHLETAGGSPRVVIPGRLSPVAIFLLLWVSFWTFGGVTAMQTFWQSVSKGSPEWFLAFWLIGWVIGESL